MVAVTSFIGLFVHTDVAVDAVRVFHIARVFRMIKQAEVSVALGPSC